MSQEEDLDAELALFETQIQRVKATTKLPDPPPKPSPEPVSKSVPQTPPTTRAAVPKSIQVQARPTAQLAQPKSQSQQTHDVKISTTPQSGAQSTSRWFWDGTTWRWRTAPTKLATTAALPTAPSSQTPATVQVSQRPSTKRTAAGEVWNDPTLEDWPVDDHRIFVGDLAPDATEKHLSDAFGVYPSFSMARVVRDKRSGACRGYGFISFSDGRDMVRALRELNGKYVGGRPVKLKRSSWQKRSLKGEKWKELKAFKKIAKR